MYSTYISVNAPQSLASRHASIEKTEREKNNVKTSLSFVPFRFLILRTDRPISTVKRHVLLQSLRLRGVYTNLNFNAVC